MCEQMRPKTLQRNENDIVLSWANDVDNIEECCLQMMDDFNCWNTLYRGYETWYAVNGLAPNQVYNFRIKFGHSADWTVFKSATSEVICYTTRHLMSAMRSQKFGLIRKIIKSRPDLLEIENKKSNTPLIQAITENNMKMANLLLHLGADVNKPLMFSKKTPLMVAVSHGTFELAKLLVNKGASTKEVDINGLNVLHYSIGHLEMTKYFVGLGLDINAKDRHGLTPLLRAVITEADEDIIEYLLQNGADKECRDRNGYSFNEHNLIIKNKLDHIVPSPKFV